MQPVRPWQELSRATEFECRMFAVERSTARSPSHGSTHDFFRIRSVDWAQIVPVTTDGNVAMIRQFRHGSSAVTLEIPGGLVEAGEDPQQTAVRECLEETGYGATTVEPLGSVNPNPALFSNRLHAFAAFDVELKVRIELSATEQTELVLVPLNELPRRLLRGEVDHALIEATLWRFLEFLRTSRRSL